MRRLSSCTTWRCGRWPATRPRRSRAARGRSGRPGAGRPDPPAQPGQPLFTEQLVGLDDRRRPAAPARRPARPPARRAGATGRVRRPGAGGRRPAPARHPAGRRRGPPARGGVDRPAPSSRTVGCCGRRPGHQVELRPPPAGRGCSAPAAGLQRSADVHRRIGAGAGPESPPSPAEVAEHWRRAEEPGRRSSGGCRGQAATQRFALCSGRQAVAAGPRPWPDDVSPWAPRPCAGTTPSSTAMDALCSPICRPPGTWRNRRSRDGGRPGADAAALYRRASVIGSWSMARGGLELVGRALDIHRSAPPSVEYVRALKEQEEQLDASAGTRAGEAGRALEVCAALDSPRMYRGLRSAGQARLPTPTPATCRAWPASTRPPTSSWTAPARGRHHLAVVRLRSSTRLGGSATRWPRRAACPGIEVVNGAGISRPGMP